MSYVGSDSHKMTALVDQNAFALGSDQRLLNIPIGDRELTASATCSPSTTSARRTSTACKRASRRTSSTTRFGSTYFKLGYTWGHASTTRRASGSGTTRCPITITISSGLRPTRTSGRRVVFSGGWDLPFGKNSSKFVKAVASGWSLYPIVTFRTGFPLDVYGIASPTSSGIRRTVPGPSGAGDQELIRADLVTADRAVLTTRNSRSRWVRPAGPLGGPVSGNFFFNPDAFSNARAIAFNDGSVPAADQRTYGSFPRNALRGPSRTNFDLSLAKMFPIRESLRAEFRADFFNILNQAQCQNPDTNIQGSTFGQISRTYDPRIIQLALRLMF